MRNQLAISELRFISLSKRVFIHNLSSANEFDLQDSKQARTRHFEMWFANTRLETEKLISLYRCSVLVVSLHIMPFSFTELHAFALCYKVMVIQIKFLAVITLVFKLRCSDFSKITIGTHLGSIRAEFSHNRANREAALTQ